jgi:uncharacterized protein YbjT (DUF2867 family)
MNGKRVILIGATGMVGGCALRLCLDNPDVSAVTVIGRRSIGVEYDKLTEVLHNDFMDYSAVAEALRNQDVALYCLGVYTGAVPDEEFRRITVDYTVAFAEALHKESPQAAFCFLSGQGADQTEQSRAAFARYKGAAEKALLDIDFPRLHIFRPGYIYPVTPRKEPNLMYKTTRYLYPLLRLVYPNIGIPSEDLARAMVHAGLHGTGGHDDPVLENKDIRYLEGI